MGKIKLTSASRSSASRLETDCNNSNEYFVKITNINQESVMQSLLTNNECFKYGMKHKSTRSNINITEMRSFLRREIHGRLHKQIQH